MASPRVRVVPGSCWPCKKRRVKCDLAKPVCRRCAADSSVQCDYSTKLIRWSTRPNRVATPSSAAANAAATAVVNVNTTTTTTSSSTAKFPMVNLGSDGGLLSLGERRALHYFHARIWPLLQSAEAPCAPPMSTVLENRVVMLATCVLSDSHRLMQEGREADAAHHGRLNPKRAECLAEMRTRVGGCLSSKNPPLMLLVAVLLLYLHDGFMEPGTGYRSTASHHTGVLALVAQMGGIEPLMRRCEPSLQMLLAEFVSTDLTTALLRGRPPSYPPSVWPFIDQGTVWWNRDPLRRASLASVLADMCQMASYAAAIRSGEVVASMDRVHAFERSLLLLGSLDVTTATSATGATGATVAAVDTAAIDTVAIDTAAGAATTTTAATAATSPSPSSASLSSSSSSSPPPPLPLKIHLPIRPTPTVAAAATTTAPSAMVTLAPPISPSSAPPTFLDCGPVGVVDGGGGGGSGSSGLSQSPDAIHAFALIQAFQHAALIYLYRAICDLPLLHPMVQQHVNAGMESLLSFDRQSKALNCVIFPLYVIGAHAQSAHHRDAALDLANLVYERMRFASVRAVIKDLRTIWDAGAPNVSWLELFSRLDAHVLVL